MLRAGEVAPLLDAHPGDLGDLLVGQKEHQHGDIVGSKVPNDVNVVLEES